MCGICGYLGMSGGEGHKILEGMTDTMIHRGPDDRGFYNQDGRIGLGHRRLSIIDLTAYGRQPMSNEKGSVHSIVNGEIYNFMELRAELESLGHTFRGACDAEIIPHAYEEWGEGFPRRLRGMFAIALWDNDTGRLLLIRDRLGIKPIYYHWKNGSLIFASELKALAAHPDFSGDISRGSLSLYLSFGYVPAPLSIYEDTYKLMPAHYLVVDGSDLRIERYWDPLAAADISLPASEGELLEMMDGLLKESVRYRLISDVPLGAFLSGGIDSSLTVAIMRAVGSSAVKTFTIGFWEKEYDEAIYARRIAEHLETEHTELYIEPDMALDVIPRLPEVYDEPFGDPSAIPTYLVSKLARQEVTVALSGDGGDELFCGYPRYSWFYLARWISGIPPAVRKGLGPAVGKLPHPKAAKAASWLDYQDSLELYFGMVGIWKRGDIEAILGARSSFDKLAFKEIYQGTASKPDLERLMLMDLCTYLPDDILTKVDRASMAHSLEVRVPLLDHHFVELALSIPLSLKFRRLRGKYLLKKLLSRYLPKKLFKRPKMGFGVPLDHWFRGQLKDLLLDYIAPDRLKREGYFKPRLIQEAVGEHLSGERNHQYSLWVLLMFQMWLEKQSR